MENSQLAHVMKLYRRSGPRAWFGPLSEMFASVCLSSALRIPVVAPETPQSFQIRDQQKRTPPASLPHDRRKESLLTPQRSSSGPMATL